MRNLLKNLIHIFTVLILLSFVFANSVMATTTTKDVNIDDIKTNSPSCILMDAKTGEILYAKNAYETRYPASTTKLMTAILTMENCELTDVATVSHNAIYSIPVGYSHANLQEGEELTIEQLLNVLLVPSANDAAIVLAEHIAGSEEAFCEMMNQKAKEIGCLNTNFVNPNGIHNKEHISTAYDLALIGKYAMQFSDIMRIAMVKQYTLPKTNKYDKENRIFNATNALINNESLNKYYYPYATGLKTGYTDSSGSCIVSTARKGDMELIAVVLKSDSIADRYEDCETLFDYGFDNYSYEKLNYTDEIIKTVEISNGTKETKNLDIAVKDEISVLLKSSFDKTTIEPTIELNSDLKAPISENSVVGKISYTIDGKTYSSDLIADSSVIPSSFEVIVFRLLLIFLILYIIYRLLKSNSKNTPSKKDISESKKNSKKSTKKNYTKKSKKSAYKSRKSKKISSDIHKIHSGKGEFKFTQINDYL